MWGGEVGPRGEERMAVHTQTQPREPSAEQIQAVGCDHISQGLQGRGGAPSHQWGHGRKAWHGAEALSSNLQAGQSALCNFSHCCPRENIPQHQGRCQPRRAALAWTMLHSLASPGRSARRETLPGNGDVVAASHLPNRIK